MPAARCAARPDAVLDLYTRQSCLLVTARDLAVMGATLADGGVNPLTGAHVVSADACRHALGAMATAGLYETSGDWLFESASPARAASAAASSRSRPARAGSAPSHRRSTLPATACAASSWRASCRAGSAWTCSRRRRPPRAACRMTASPIKSTPSSRPRGTRSTTVMPIEIVE